MILEPKHKNFKDEYKIKVRMILEPKHKNFKDEYKIKVRVKKKLYIRRHMSI